MMFNWDGLLRNNTGVVENTVQKVKNYKNNFTMLEIVKSFTYYDKM